MNLPSNFDKPVLTEQQSENLPCWRLLAVIFGFFLCYVFVAVDVFDRFPNSGDEYSYLLQAKIFSTGRLSIPSVPEKIRDFFQLDHVIDDGRVRSKYSPGWPLLLCLVEPMGLSWFLNPLLGALTLYFLFHLASALLNRRMAWIVIVTTGSCPFFIYNSASFFSHTAALMFMVLSLYMVAVRARHRQIRACVLAGIIAGFTFLIRPLDGVVCIAALLLMSIQYRNVKMASAVLAGAVPMVVAYLAYNHIQFGGAFITGYEMYRPTLIKMIGASHVRPEFSWINLKMYMVHLQWMIQFAEWIVPGVFFLLPIGAWHLYKLGSSSTQRTLVFGAGLLIILFIMLQFTTTGAGDCYGPRYLYTWILPVALFIAAGAEFVEKHSSATVRWIWIVMVCMMAIANGISVIWNGYSIRKKIIERSGVYHLVAANGLHRAVIFLRDTDFYTPNWYTRNGINYRGDVVYVFDFGARKNERLRACYPDYHFYQYRAIGSNRSTKAVVPYYFGLNADED